MPSKREKFRLPLSILAFAFSVLSVSSVLKSEFFRAD